MTIIRPIALLASCVVVSAMLGASTLQQTLLQQAAANHGQPLVIPFGGHVREVSFERLVNDAELIVIAQLGRANSYLIGNDMAIATDYDVIPKQVICDDADVVSKSQSTQTPLRLMLFGGELVLGGVTVTVYDVGMRRWRQDANLLLFLSSSDKQNQYYPQPGAGGAFEIDTDGRVRSLRTRGTKQPEIEGLDLSTVLEKIEGSLQRK